MPNISNFLMKLPLVILGGSLATFALFFAMQALIQEEYELPGPSEYVDPIEIAIPEIEVVANKKARKPPEPDKIPDMPELLRNDIRIPSQGPVIPQRTSVEPLELGSGILAAADSSALPIVRIAPTYPARGLQRGIEGYVVVEFDVDENGQVINPRVLYGEPPGFFDRAAINALERWRYNPKIVDGKQVPMYGLQQRLTFELAD